LDPTKLKPRQFSRGTTAPVNSKNDMSLWTETPTERLQRLSDEVSGKKRRVTDAPVDEDETSASKKRRRKAEEEAIRMGVEEHTVRFFLCNNGKDADDLQFSAAQEPWRCSNRPARKLIFQIYRKRGSTGHLGPFAGYGLGWSPDGRRQAEKDAPRSKGSWRPFWKRQERRFPVI